MNYLKLYFKKVFYFIDSSYNKKISIIGILIFLNMFLELISVGLIFPLVGIILDPTFLDNYPILKNLFFAMSPFKFLDVDITFHLITGALFVFLFLIILKNIFVFCYNSYRQNFIYKLQLGLRIKSLQRLIGFPYDEFLKENSADLITKNTYLECISVAVENFLVIVTETIVLFSFIALFFFLDPISMSIIIFIIFPCVFLLSKTTRKKLLNYGDERRINDTLQLQYFTNIINGIKEIKLFNNHQYFLDFFYKHSKKNSLC